MDEVNRVRARIDDIDREIVQLLKSRFENAKLLGQVKRTRGLSLRDPEREKRILRSVERLAARMDLDPYLVRQIFGRILKMSVSAQRSGSPATKLNLAGFEVLVVGGTGGMGRFFARFAKAQGASVRIAGRRVSRTRKIARELGLIPGTIHDAMKAKLVIVAVPIEMTEEVSLTLTPLMKDGSFLTDLSSVKTGVADRIAKGSPDEIEYVSLHPLFGPDIDHIYGQNVIAIPYREGVGWWRLSRVLTAAGARVHTTSAESHDRTMAYVQGLHHYALACLGLSLSEWDGSYATNSLRVTEERIRLLVQNWDTMIGIQRLNPFLPHAKEGFRKIVNGLLDMNSGEAQSALGRLRVNVQKWSRKQ